MKNINIKLIATIAFVSLIAFSCGDDFLDYTPAGVVSSDDLNSAENIEKMVIAAYSAQGNDHFNYPMQDMYNYGVIASGDAYTGGAVPFHSFSSPMEMRNFQKANNWLENELMYKYLYVCISRINDAMTRLNAITDAEMSTRSDRIAEMRFLRAQTYFKLKVIYKFIVYVDENIPKEEYNDHHNRELSDQDGWQWIIDEWRAAVAGLPTTQADEGRPTKGAAQLFLAKSLIYKAHVQDDQHQLASINTSELNEAISLFETVDASGEFALASDISDNFRCETESGIESVWAIMRSHDDGNPSGRGNWSGSLNPTMGPGYGCCWVTIPSQNMANAFQTDANGHPLFDTYDTGPQIETSADVEANNMDPRFSHTMAVIGMPWKYDPNRIFDKTYSRTPGIYGFHGQFKDHELPENPCMKQHTAFMHTSRNTDQMRYADALLFWAEALIQSGRHTEALPLINRVRERAGSIESLSKLVKADGSPSGNYVLGLYTAADFDTQEKAFLRLTWERRIEFAFEGHPGRWFDLLRWGIAGDWCDAYYASESQRRDYLQAAFYTRGRDEYSPIPDSEIIVSQGLMTQNPGY